jgi:CRP/FNR family transcriptional regulator, anaerobic regulatory protein
MDHAHIQSRYAGAVIACTGDLRLEMDIGSVKSRLKALYPALASMSEPALDEMLAASFVKTIPRGSVLFDENSPCQAFPMIIEGSVRVIKTAASGRELQLYRVLPGESCILSTGCMLGNTPYSASGVAESEITLVLLPPHLFHKLLGEHSPFRNYVFGLFAERITELMQLVEAVAFHKLDQRLAALLLGKGKVVHATHQQLADELGSVREIVSRLLKTFAERGLVSLGREEIELVNASALRQIAEGA